MKYFKLIISLFLTICFLASCSIEKRVYMNGYHVEWNKSENKTAAQPELKIQTIKRIPNKIISNFKKREVLQANHFSDLKTIFQKPEKKDTTHYIVKKKQTVVSAQNDSGEKNDGIKKPNRMASISSTLAVTALIGIIISIALGWGFFVLFMLPAIPAVIFGVFASVQIKNNPGVYTNRWEAILGTILGSLEILALLAFMREFIINFL